MLQANLVSPARFAPGHSLGAARFISSSPVELLRVGAFVFCCPAEFKSAA
jgi:hypothetical protein